jgi:cell division protein FtsA
MILAKSLDKSALREQIGAGIVLTGGLTKLKGIRELAQAIFQGMPVRIGTPRELGGMYDELKDPAFATVIGLLLYQAGEHTRYEINYNKELLHRKETATHDVTDIGELTPEAGASEKSKATKKRKPSETEFDLSLPGKSGKGGLEMDDNLLPSNFKKRDGNAFSRFVNWAKQLF